MSPEVCVAGSCAGPSRGPSFVIQVALFAFVAASVQLDPGGTGICDNACVSYTGFCPAAVGRDLVVPIVIEIRVVDFLSGAGVCVASVGLFV